MLGVDSKERTYIMIKPDSVQRALVGEIIKRFEQKGFCLVAIKMVQASREQILEHYKHLKPSVLTNVVKYMLSGPIVCMVWKGYNAVKAGRLLKQAIRDDFSHARRSIVHGSDNVDEAEREISIWFKPNEIVHWISCHKNWINQ